MTAISSFDGDCPNCGLDLMSEVEKATHDHSTGYRTALTVYCPMCETEVDFTVDWEPTWATLVDHRPPYQRPAAPAALPVTDEPGQGSGSVSMAAGRGRKVAP